MGTSRRAAAEAAAAAADPEESFDLEEDDDDEVEEEEDAPMPERPAPIPINKRTKKANGGTDETPEQKFNRIVLEANKDGKETLFDHYVIDITYESGPGPSYRGRECRFVFPDGEKELSPSFSGLSQRVAEDCWDGSTQLFRWAVRNHNGVALGRGKLPFVSNAKRQAEYAVTVAGVRKRIEATAAPADPSYGAVAGSDDRRRRLEDEDRQYAEERRRRREREEQEEEDRRKKARAGEDEMPKDVYTYRLEQRMVEEKHRAERERDEDRRRNEEDRRRSEEHQRAQQASIDALAKTMALIAEKISQPAVQVAAAVPPQAAPRSPFDGLPNPPRGHEYVLLDGVPVLRAIAAVPVKDEDEQKTGYKSVFRQMKEFKDVVDQGAQFFGDSGKGEGGTSTSDDPPAAKKRLYEEIPDGNGGVAWRVVEDPETGLPSTDIEKIASVNGDIILREGKKLVGNLIDAWKASKAPDGQRSLPSNGGERRAADPSILDRDLRKETGNMATKKAATKKTRMVMVSGKKKLPKATKSTIRRYRLSRFSPEMRLWREKKYLARELLKIFTDCGVIDMTQIALVTTAFFEEEKSRTPYKSKSGPRRIYMGSENREQRVFDNAQDASFAFLRGELMLRDPAVVSAADLATKVWTSSYAFAEMLEVDRPEMPTRVAPKANNAFKTKKRTRRATVPS